MTVKIITITIEYFANTGSKQEILNFVLSHNPSHPSLKDDIFILKNIYMTAVHRPLLPEEERFFESTQQSFYVLFGMSSQTGLNLKQFQCQRKIVELFSLFEKFFTEPTPLLQALFLVNAGPDQFEKMCFSVKSFFKFLLVALTFKMSFLKFQIPDIDSPIPQRIARQRIEQYLFRKYRQSSLPFLIESLSGQSWILNRHEPEFIPRSCELIQSILEKIRRAFAQLLRAQLFEKYEECYGYLLEMIFTFKHSLIEYTKQRESELARKTIVSFFVENTRLTHAKIANARQLITHVNAFKLAPSFPLSFSASVEGARQKINQTRRTLSRLSILDHSGQLEHLCNTFLTNYERTCARFMTAHEFQTLRHTFAFESLILKESLAQFPMLTFTSAAQPVPMKVDLCASDTPSFYFVLICLHFSLKRTTAINARIGFVSVDLSLPDESFPENYFILKQDLHALQETETYACPIKFENYEEVFSGRKTKTKNYKTTFYAALAFRKFDSKNKRLIYFNSRHSFVPHFVRQLSKELETELVVVAKGIQYGNHDAFHALEVLNYLSTCEWKDFSARGIIHIVSIKYPDPHRTDGRVVRRISLDAKQQWVSVYNTALMKGIEEVYGLFHFCHSPTERDEALTPRVFPVAYLEKEAYPHFSNPSSKTLEACFKYFLRTSTFEDKTLRVIHMCEENGRLTDQSKRFLEACINDLRLEHVLFCIIRINESYFSYLIFLNAREVRRAIFIDPFSPLVTNFLYSENREGVRIPSVARIIPVLSDHYKWLAADISDTCLKLAIPLTAVSMRKAQFFPEDAAFITLETMRYFFYTTPFKSSDPYAAHAQYSFEIRGYLEYLTAINLWQDTFEYNDESTPTTLACTETRRAALLKSKQEWDPYFTSLFDSRKKEGVFPLASGDLYCDDDDGDDVFTVSAVSAV